MAPERVQLRDTARALLESGRVDMVLGYTPGTRPLAAVPAFARQPSDADALVFDRTCEANLANYLHRLKGRKVGIVVKGCDERSVIGLVQEKQVRREDLVVIGAPCRGVVDPRKVVEAAGFDPVGTAAWSGDELTVRNAAGRAATLAVDTVIYDACRACPVRNPRFADVVIAEPVPQPAVPELSPEVAAVEAQSPAERWARFQREMGKCILCFACRSVCPACYCTECFTESSQPKWMSKTADPADAMFFHLTRLLHLTGRCTGCGACVRACPVNVDLRLYNDKLRRDVKEIFGFEAGMDPEAKAPLTCFRLDDRNEFIR